MSLELLRHSLADDALARLRDRHTPTALFRREARRIGLLLAAEALRSVPSIEGTVETPLEAASVRRVGTHVVLVPVLRAGLGLLEPFLELVPEAEVGYLGLERDEHTAVARRYYEKVPADLGDATVFLLDPMLATGGSAVQAAVALQEKGARAIQVVCVVAAPEGLAHLEAHVPGTRVVAVALDRALDERKFILPGLGDYGDRLHGT
jgi:uracil phosphoribosyltransferase